MATTDILSAFTTRLNTLAFSPELPIAWPGINFDPPSTGMWLEARFFPNEPGDLTWDVDGCLDTRGFCQVLVCYRPGTSQISASEIADAIIVHFPKSTTLDAVRVRKSPWQSPAVDTEGRSFIPVTVPYRGILLVAGSVELNFVVDGGVNVVDGGIQVIST